MLLSAESDCSDESSSHPGIELQDSFRDSSQQPLSEAEVAAILKAEESARLEFKRVSGKMVSKALETLCAFANSNGGTLILGLADPGVERGANRIHGIEE